MLLTWHNLHYYQDLMSGIRKSISAGTFAAFADSVLHAEAEGDVAPPD